MEFDFDQDLDKQYMKDYEVFQNTLKQMNIAFKNDPNRSIPNKNPINFRTPIPFSIQASYNNATQNLVFFLHKNLASTINKINVSSYPTSKSKHSPASIMEGQNKKICQIINELAMAIFFSPIPDDKILNDYLNKVESSLKYLFKNLSQTNQPINYDNNPFLSSILLLFTFTVILYSVARKGKLDLFLGEIVNTEENDYGRLICYHAQDIDSLIQNFLRTPNQYSIKYHSEIKKMSEKLANLFKSMEVRGGEFVAKPLNDEIEYGIFDKVRPIFLGDPPIETNLDKKNEKDKKDDETKLRENDYFVHLDRLYATSPFQNPFGELLQRFDSSSIKKKPNRDNYILFDSDEVGYFHNQ